MAYVKNREKSDGSVSYTVMWRAGGARGAKQESEVFEEETAAERFKDLVNGHGQQWPPGWVRGKGFVADQRKPGSMFEAFALAYVDRLTGIQGDTKAKYRRRIKANMVPWFGPYSVEDGEGGIIRDMVQDWVNDLEAGRPALLDPPDRRPRTKYKPKTVTNEHGLLYSILQAAVDAEPSLRASNPCAKTRLPRLDAGQDDETMVFLEREEFAWIHECLADDAKDLNETLGETGFRWGEATALQPRDLIKRNGRPAIRVSRAWKKDENEKPYLGAPKTRKSRRTAVVTWALWNKLKQRAKGLLPTALLFTGPEGKRWDPGTYRRLRWIPAIELAVERYGLAKRPRIHDVRHSHVSWLIAAKVPLPAIQARLGHESITTTVDRYGHLLDALDDEVMAAVAWAMDPTQPLPGFLSESGLAESTSDLPPAVPAQRTEGSADEDTSPAATTANVSTYVVVLPGREVAFAEHDHALQVVAQWNDDAADEEEALRAVGWTEEQIGHADEARLERREEWMGDGAVWTRMPDRQLVHYRWAEFQPDGELAHEPPPFRSAWTWEFEPETYTSKPAEWEVGYRPGSEASTEAQVRGVTRSSVVAAFEFACRAARDVCSQSPHLVAAEPL
ncbi:tyrosine-type recombinase/integrase [Streptomyces sp. NPDC056773]|uniref:tyrosine-type recombinase/integrase n=1 Tax=unclassified Streptomyces TaxID=2593676 RepID=UPI00368B489E